MSEIRPFKNVADKLLDGAGGTFDYIFTARPEIISLLEKAMRLTAHATNKQYGRDDEFLVADEVDVAQLVCNALEDKGE
jgi:hypothetical protein